MTLLTKLNECRLETRKGLKVYTRVIPPTAGATKIAEGEQFQLAIAVRNILEEGRGDGAQGNAHFKNIKVRVWGADEYVELLDGQNGKAVPDNTKSYPIQIRKAETLAEGKLSKWRKVWFRATHGCDELEQVASVRVTAVFDVERYFTSKISRRVHFDIVHV